MSFNSGTDDKKLQANWISNNKVIITLPPSELSDPFPQRPSRMRESLHGVNIVIANDLPPAGASKAVETPSKNKSQ